MRVDLKSITVTLAGVLKRNAPVRGKNMPAGWSERKRTNYLKPTKLSPYPGNLKNNGISYYVGEKAATIEIGGSRASYADYTERKSFSPGWMEKSTRELVELLRMQGGRVR
jgi:hypothetical protein